MAAATTMSSSSSPPAPPLSPTMSDAEMVEHSIASSSFVEEFEVEIEGQQQPDNAQRDGGLRFTADSPYFTSFVEQEMSSLSTLKQALGDISARAQTFGKCGVVMAEATRRLSMSCKLKPSEAFEEENKTNNNNNVDKVVASRRESLGEEMASVLHVLGEVLEEIADAQVQMCESIEASLSMTLDAFAETEVEEVLSIKQEAESLTESSEASYSKYLNSRHAEKLTTQSQNFGSEDAFQALTKLSDSVGNHIGSTLKKQWGLGQETPNQERRKSKQKSPAEGNPALATAMTSANLQLTLQQIQLAQASAELQRFKLVKKLVNIKKRRNFELGESALASLHGIRAYFHHCSDLMQGMSPILNKIQDDQQDSRQMHEKQQAPWFLREANLERTVQSMGEAATNGAYVAEAIHQGDEGLAQAQPTTLSEIETKTQFWNLPVLLAHSARYQREPPPGVLVEGWLYKKSSSRMALQQWNKRWFIMDKDGIYYFRCEPKKQTTSYLESLERVKICDIVLCTVRELLKHNVRFCFEICTPHQKPIMLQARGPLEYRHWIDSIRTCVETQIVHGSVHVDGLNQGIGKSSKKNHPTETLKSMLADKDGLSEKALSQLHEEHVDDEDGASAAIAKQPSNGKNNNNTIHIAPPRRQISQEQKEIVKEIYSANPYCADCNAPNPEWASLNLGVLVCIECSGVHRSLGVHLSKMRSLMLDSITDAEGRLLLSLGNDRVNAIWEAEIGQQRGWKKPVASDNRKTKEDWIRSKYEWKGFLHIAEDGSTHEERVEIYNTKLLEAAANCNVLEIVQALAMGAQVNFQDAEQQQTALHKCVLSHSSHNIECAELLIQNGAKLDILDHHTQSALDCAVCGNATREMVEYLSHRS